MLVLVWYLRNALAPRITLNEQKILLAFLYPNGELCRQSAAVTALHLEDPKSSILLHQHLPPQSKRMELRCFTQAVV